MALESFKKKTVNSITIQLGSSIGVKIVSFIQTIIFARIFFPTDFGIFATASLVVSFVMLFNEIGINDFIVKEKENIEKVMDNLFSLNIFIGLFFFIIIFMSAPLAADLFSNDNLVLYIRFLSYSAFGATLGLPNMLLVKNMKFGMATLPTFLSIVGNTVVAYVAAVIFNLGTWGLFLGALAGFVINAMVIWIIAPYRPKLGFDIELITKAYSFGWPLLIGSLLNFISWQADDLTVRYLWGSEQLGIYTFAFYLPVFILKIIEKINSVLFSAFSKIQDREDELKYAFQVSSRYIAFIFAPIGVSFFVFAPQIVHFVYTDRWIDAVPLLRLSSLAFITRAVIGLTWRKIALVKGDTRYIMHVEIINALFMCTIGIYLIYSYGILGGAYYNMLIQIVVIPSLALYYIKKQFGDSKIFSDIFSPLFISITLAMPIYLLNLDYKNLYLFLAALSIYFVIYIIVITVTDKSILKEIYSLTINSLNRK